MSTNTDKVFIVGSGPSGVAAAHALLKQGAAVCMLDVGITLEQERRDQVSVLLEAGDVEGCRAVIRDRPLLQSPATNYFRKLAYGSDFPYRNADRFIGCEPGPHEIHSSFALGGLSNVWGATVLPFADEDITDWPVQSRAIDSHYRAVLSFMGLSGREDSLASHFPLFCEPAAPLDLSPASQALLNVLEENKAALESQGIYAGRARIAIGAAYSGGNDAGLFPGLFIHGATNGATFNAAEEVEALKKKPGFEYVSDIVVTGFREDGESVRLFAERRSVSETIEFTGSRVFLACGVMPTARIVLSSLGAYDRPVTMRQSLHFFLPVIHFWPRGQEKAVGSNTLAEIFLALRGSGETESWTFFLLNRMSDFFIERIRERYGPLGIIVQALQSSPVLNIFICQGYLHSNLSPTIKLALKRGPSGTEDTIRIAPPSHRQASKVARHIVSRLGRGIKRAGAFPVNWALDAGIPGRGNHVGGTFPMRDQPGDLECDTLGRPKGLSRVHIVDASVLPSIPATTITLGVMANAYRIAEAGADL